MMNHKPDFWVVGGFVRDFYLNQIYNANIYSKDVDISLELDNTGDIINAVTQFDPNADIRVIDSNFNRILAGVELAKFNWLSKNYPQKRGKTPRVIYCDFVGTRKEGDYNDGAHPSILQFAPIEVDLERRDFTVNSIAVNDTTEEVLDLFGGIQDIKDRKLTTIRDPNITFSEHGIRILRALRISLEKKLNISRGIWMDLSCNAEMYEEILRRNKLQDSIRSELTRMIKFDTIRALHLITALPYPIKSAIFADNWLKATNEKR